MNIEKYIREHKSELDDKRMPDYRDREFEDLLKSELHNSGQSIRRKRIWALSIAASIVVVIAIGAVFTMDRMEELETRDQLVMALGEDQTNSTRLQAIYEIEDLSKRQKEDEKILEAFFKILKDDSDSNSKIAVIDALLAFPENEAVRENIIEALANEKEPLVQLKLIKSVTILRDRRAKEPLQEIINDTETLPVVKGNANASLAMLNKK
ncbi:MAG: HEAT repeat domain-containing protein [Bacteroidota bacterium]